MRPLLPILALVAACRGDGDAAPVASTARDSAGVRIIEHTSFDGLPVRHAVDPPVITIGTQGGDETQQLDDAFAGMVLPDGRIAILNSGTSEVRFYGPDGTLAATQGRFGAGPGEYRRAIDLYLMSGDSLLVWDATLMRGTVVAPDLTVARTVLLEGEGYLLPYGVFADGRVLAVQRFVGVGPTPMAAGVRERQFDYVFSPEGTHLADLGEHPGRLVMLYEGPIPVTGTPDPTRSYTIADIPFGAATQRAVAGDGYWTSTQQTREVVFRDRAGAARTLVRWEGTPIAPTEADKRAWVEDLTGIVSREESRATLRTLPLDAFQFPESFPAHGPLLATDDGSLWIADYPRPTYSGPARWTVLALDGTARERVELPGGSTLLWASGERVLIRLEDELGVQRVELRGLEAPEAAPR
jgi:hypothetical protein